MWESNLFLRLQCNSFGISGITELYSGLPVDPSCVLYMDHSKILEITSWELTEFQKDHSREIPDWTCWRIPKSICVTTAGIAENIPEETLQEISQECFRNSQTILLEHSSYNWRNIRSNSWKLPQRTTGVTPKGSPE